jgi:diaminopimelate decarboxylase
VAHDVMLPAGLARGDLLAVATTGAYTYPLASAYNRFGRPAVVGVRDGSATVWVRREDVDDMDMLDVILGTAWEAGSLPAAEGGART